MATSSTSWDNSSAWYRYNELYAYTGENLYPIGDRYLVKGKVLLCGTTVGVAGVLVVYQRGSFAYTDANGEFTIIAHELGDAGGRGSGDKIIYSQRGKCQIYQCDTCDYCFPEASVLIPSCSEGDERSYSVPDVNVRIRGLNKRGPQWGGRYG